MSKESKQYKKFESDLEELKRIMIEGLDYPTHCKCLDAIEGVLMCMEIEATSIDEEGV